MWLQYDILPLWHVCPGVSTPARLYLRLHLRGAINNFATVRKSAGAWLTRFGAVAYIAPTRRAAARRDDAPAKLLTDNGDQPSDL